MICLYIKDVAPTLIQQYTTLVYIRPQTAVALIIDFTLPIY